MVLRLWGYQCCARVCDFHVMLHSELALAVNQRVHRGPCPTQVQFSGAIMNRGADDAR